MSSSIYIDQKEDIVNPDRYQPEYIFAYAKKVQTKNGEYTKNEFFERLYDLQEQKSIIRPFDPVFEVYTPDPQGEYKYLLNENVRLKKHEFRTNKEYKEFVETFKMVNKPIYGNTKPVYQRIRQFFNKKHHFKSRTWFLDIEAVPPPKMGFPDPTEVKFPIQVIQILDNILNKKIILTTVKLSDEEYQELIDEHGGNNVVIIKYYETEKQLLNGFLALLNKLNPTIITAWNGDYFDFPYITNRIEAVLGERYKELSPIDRISKKYDKEAKSDIFKWEGIYLVDLMKAFKKFTFETLTSYSLENTAKSVLGEEYGKVDYGEFRNISEFFIGNPKKFLDYSIVDIEILEMIDTRINLIEIMRMLASQMGVNYDDSMGTIKQWAMFIMNTAYNDKLILPEDKEHTLDTPIVGGFVKDPLKGVFKWVKSVDINSMYPLLGMVGHNISPETYVSRDIIKSSYPELNEIMEKYQMDEIEDKFVWDELETNKKSLEEIRRVSKKYGLSFGINGFFKNYGEIGKVPKEVSYYDSMLELL